jgi:sugar/nucleoside kinase (ribokinase family)
MNPCEIAVVGEIYIDHIFMGFASWPQPGEEAFAQQYVREIGGGAANTACALGRLGRNVSLLGVIGASDAEWFDGRLQEFGVASHGIMKTHGSTGVTASVSMMNDRSFFTYAGENGKLMSILRLDTMIASLKCARHVVAVYLLPALRSAGCTTSLDVGFQREWLRSPVSLDICRATDYFLPNEKEAFLMCSGGPLEYLAFAEQQGFPRAIVKLGSRGAVMMADGSTYEISSPMVDVVDTTGAGDAFNAGFIDALLDGANPDECLRRACIVGGLSTRVAGALRALPHREEIVEIYEQTYAS